MHLSGALYMGRNSKPGTKVDKTTPKPDSGESSTVAVSGQNNVSDGPGQPLQSRPGPVAPKYTLPDADVLPRQRHNSVARAPEPLVATSLNGIPEDDKTSPRQECAPLSKPTKPSPRRKDSSPRVTSEVLGRGRSHSIGDPSGVPSDIVRIGPASPRRSSPLTPDPGLADDEEDVNG